MALLLTTTLAAQAVKDSIAPKLYFLTSGALGVPDKQFKPGIANGFQAATGLEYKLSRHSTIAGEVSFDGYGIKQASPSYSLEGSLNIISLALFYKHTFGNSKWQPYLRAGGGGARVSVPAVTVKSAFAEIRNRAQVVGQIQAEGGIQLEVAPRYTLLAGVSRQWLGESAVLKSPALRVTGLKLGFITPL